MVEIDQGVFNILQIQVAVPNTATIQAVYAVDAIATQLGPYAAADAGTEIVKTQKLSRFHISWWGLACRKRWDRLTYWRVDHPMVVVTRKGVECRALIQYFQIAVTTSSPNGAAGGPSLLDIARPSMPPRNAALQERVHEILEHHFIQLCRDSAAQQPNQIASALGTMSQKNRSQCEEAKQEMDDANAQGSDGV